MACTEARTPRAAASEVTMLNASRYRRLLRLSLAAALVLVASRSYAQPFSSDHKAKVLMFGDSILFESKHYARWALELGGKAEVRAFATSGSALCAWFPGSGSSEFWIPTDIATQVREWKPDAVVFQFWGNANFLDISPCMGDLQRGDPDHYRRYREDAVAAMWHVLRGALDAEIATPKVYWVLQPPDPYRPEIPRLIDEGYRQLATDDTWSTVRFADAGDSVSLSQRGGGRYDYTRWLPCLPGWESVENNTCRATGYGGLNIVRDGSDANQGIHFCPEDGRIDDDGACSVYSSGALRYGLGIANPILDELGLR